MTTPDGGKGTKLLRSALGIALVVCLLAMPVAAFTADQSPFAPDAGIVLPEGDDAWDEGGSDDESGFGGSDWFLAVALLAIGPMLFAIVHAREHRRLKRRRHLWRSGRDPPPCTPCVRSSRERPDTGLFDAIQRSAGDRGSRATSSFFTSSSYQKNPGAQTRLAIAGAIR